MFAVAPPHSWYPEKSPGSALALGGDRTTQVKLSRLRSGHTGSLKFINGEKTFQICTKCASNQASPAHLLECMGLLMQDLLTTPLLVYDFLRINKLLDLV